MMTAAFTLPTQDCIELVGQWQHWLSGLTPSARHDWVRRLQSERIEELGLVAFFARHPTLTPPVVLAPVTAHYSWSKGLKLLGLGRAQLLAVPERGMRMDTDALDDLVNRLRAERRPVLLTVAVLGTTEFGTIDPVHRILACRDQHAATGFGAGVHVDAAWGGYLATLFRTPEGTLRAFSDMRQEFSAFPSRDSYDAIAALGGSDSITVDPHKLGYLPYGAGAFICRDQRAMPLLVEDADYVFAGGTGNDYFAQFRKLGRYILEGSKSGAAAAAVYVTHSVLPLDYTQFGRITAETIHSAEAFAQRIERFACTAGGTLSRLRSVRAGQ
ncbi:pyridoxal-dependent decarboxylase [Paucibacter sp. O1-1]|nr:pyridoxal-dependent decarboxylase [Paucibacter sp. O1-1]MDA3831025.1 pyridoxal-dependent decarboxylase [Paucibacter sp. O1-1]